MGPRTIVARLRAEDAERRRNETDEELRATEREAVERLYGSKRHEVPEGDPVVYGRVYPTTGGLNFGWVCTFIGIAVAVPLMLTLGVTTGWWIVGVVGGVWLAVRRERVRQMRRPVVRPWRRW